MSPSRSSGLSAATIVIALGIASAVALLAVSFADLGDPYAAARGRSMQAVRGRTVEVRLAWNRIQTEGPAPPGSGRVLTAGPSVHAPSVLAPPPAEAHREQDPLVQGYFRIGHEALAKGNASRSFEAFAMGLRQASSGASGRAEALYGAARAAGALGRTAELRALRDELVGSTADFLVEGTSARLLSCLIAPVDATAAFEMLKDRSAALPAPKDRLVPGPDDLVLRPDPWWAALERLLAAERPGLDWDAAFLRTERLGAAAQAFLRASGLTPNERWTISLAEGVPFAHRNAGDRQEVALVCAPDLFAALGSPDRSPVGGSDGGPAGDQVVGPASDPGEDELDVHFARSGAAGPSMTRLVGTPFSYRVEHIDPESGAHAEARRLRFLRAGLVGLGLLVLLASFLSARAMARARRLAELRSTFVASVSHDLRTPTQAILLLAETLEKKLVTDPESQGRYHVQIRREAQRLRRLVEDLLDGARIDRGGGARIERTSVDAAAFFDELGLAMEERALMAKAALTVDRGDLPTTIHVDPDGVHRAVWNLFENALHHGRAEGERATVHVEVRAEGGLLRVEVQDEGPGIPLRYRESVFDAFQRLGDQRSEDGIDKDTGTGLGLAIVRALGVAHGGGAQVVPTERGARIAVTFQIAEPSEEREDGDAA